MGRQINYYMDKELEVEFIAYIFEKGFDVIDCDLIKKEIVVYHRVEQIEQQGSIFYLHKKEFGELIPEKKCYYRLDYTISPVIEFSRTVIRRDEKTISPGRLWVESNYYDESGNIITKDAGLIKEYEALVRWIKKKVKYQEIPMEKYIYKEYVSEGISTLMNEGFSLMD